MHSHLYSRKCFVKAMLNVNTSKMSVKKDYICTFLKNLNQKKMKRILFSIVSLSLLSQFSFAQCNELFISEYVEGSGNNKALEIYNPTSTAINLSNYWIKRYSNGSTSNAAGGEQQLSGTIQPFSTFIIVNGQTTAQGATSPACDPTLQALINAPNNGMLDGVYPATTYMNGDDAITLEKGATAAGAVIVDIFGKIGEDPGTAWTNQSPFTDAGGGAWITSNHTLIRKASIKGGVTTNPSLFDALSQYDTLPENTWSNLGTHSCECFVGIKEIKNVGTIKIFPNPTSNAHGNITVSSTKSIRSISLFDLTGSVVLEGANVAANSNSINMDVTSLSKGIYFIKVIHPDNYISIEKLIIE